MAIAYGEPIEVPREGGDAALDEVTERIRERLVDLEREAAGAIGAEPDA